MSIINTGTKRIDKTFASVKVYSNEDDQWAYIRPPIIGDIKQSVRNSDHDGWMICDGRSLSRTDYALLFSIIGTTFGSSSSTTFNLPDARGRVIGTIGAGPTLTNRTLGQTVGAETHTMTVNQMPSHTHSINDPGHTHSYINNINNQSTDNAFATESAADNVDLAATTGSNTTGITINSTGNGEAFNIMQPTLFLANVFIFGEIEP